MPSDDGFKELQQKLQALRGDAYVKAQRRALREVGGFIKAELVENTPVKAGTESGLLKEGELAESIRAYVSVPSDEKVLSGATAKVTVGPSGASCKLVAHDVEYGHKNIKRGKQSEKRPETPPHPFIRTTADQTESAAIDLYRASMTDELQKAMR